jgi:hypothetical protein
MANTGNLDYSLNKDSFYKIIKDSIHQYIRYYLILIIISVIYIGTIKYKQYIFGDRKDDDIMHYFKSITYNSPFHILNLSQEKNSVFMGLTKTSYIFIIVTYIITSLLILEGLLRNFLYSIYVRIIQVNSNNNPYNNVNCISKINENPNVSVRINYIAIIAISINFLVPFIIPYLLGFLKFDNYDIKHTIWIRYVILYFIFYPFIMIIVLKGTFFKKLEVFSGIDKFIETKDYGFVQFIKNNFNYYIFTIIPFLFIIFVFCYYVFIYTESKYDFNKKIKIYFIIFFILFIFFPLFLVFFILSNLFNNNFKNDSTGNTFEDINNNSVTDIYTLLVKYNYPCFIK